MYMNANIPPHPTPTPPHHQRNITTVTHTRTQKKKTPRRPALPLATTWTSPSPIHSVTTSLHTDTHTQTDMHPCIHVSIHPDILESIQKWLGHLVDQRDLQWWRWIWGKTGTTVSFVGINHMSAIKKQLTDTVGISRSQAIFIGHRQSSECHSKHVLFLDSKQCSSCVCVLCQYPGGWCS